MVEVVEVSAAIIASARGLSLQKMTRRQLINHSRALQLRINTLGINNNNLERRLNKIEVDFEQEREDVYRDFVRQGRVLMKLDRAVNAVNIDNRGELEILFNCMKIWIKQAMGELPEMTDGKENRKPAAC